MKKLLSIVLSVAMLMTVACSMFVMPATAEGKTIDFMLEEYIAEGKDNVTINEDGTWTITGDIALAPRITFDYNVYSYIEVVFESTVPVSVTLLDRDPLYDDGTDADNNGDGNGYGQHWINLEDNWINNTEHDGCFTAGSVSYTGTQGGFKSIYDWNTKNGDWGNTGTATARAIYIKPKDGTVTLSKLGMYSTLSTININSREEIAESWDNSFDLAVKDASVWSTSPVGDSDATVVIGETDVTIGNTAGAYPSAYIEYAQPVTVPYADSAVYLDLSVLPGYSSNVYLYFGDATTTDFTGEGKLAVRPYEVDGDYAASDYIGYVYLADIIPADSDVIDADGNVTISAIKVFAIGNATEKAVVVNAFDVLYNDAEEVNPPIDEPTLGDVDLNGEVDIFDAMAVYMYADGSATLSDDALAVADYNEDGSVDIFDAMALYLLASGG